jgi:hypothetical protein
MADGITTSSAMASSKSDLSATLPAGTRSVRAEERLRGSLASLRLEVEKALRRPAPPAAPPVHDAAGSGDGFEATIRTYMTALRRLLWRKRPLGEV